MRHTLWVRLLGEDDLATSLEFRIVMHHETEGNTTFEIWECPDYPIPGDMISALIGFLEQFVCPHGTSITTYGIRKLDAPASLLRRMMGSEWMGKFIGACAPKLPVPTVEIVDTKQKSMLNYLPKLIPWIREPRK